MPLRYSRIIALLISLLWFGTLPADAQTVPLADILPQLLDNTITLQPDPRVDQPNHEAHFIPQGTPAQVPGQFNQALLTLLSTYPIGSPSGGFTYTFDPALGSFSRNTQSFGPAFAERALTIGRGKASLGVDYQHATYDTFEGKNLKQRELIFYIRHDDCCSQGGGRASAPDNSLLTPAFEGDIIKASLRLDLSTDTTVVFANYGITDRFDIGVSVPFVRANMDANILAHIDRLSTAAEPTTHEFEGPDPDNKIFALSGQSAGLGDMVVRAKYRLPKLSGLAVAEDLHLPTGDETNLRGTGGVQSRTMLIASISKWPIAPHVNLGYTISSDGALQGTKLRDEVTTAFGVDGAVSPRVSFAADVLTRTVLRAGRFREGESIFDYTVGGTGSGSGGGGGGTGGGSSGGSGGSGGGGTSTRTVLSTTRTELQLQEGRNLNLAFGSASVRFSPWRTMLVSASLLFPLTEAGLRDRVTPVIGIDYAF